MEIMGRDQAQRMHRCSQEDRAPVVLVIAQVVRWEKLWDAALDEGPHCIHWMKHLVKALCHRRFGDRLDCTHEIVDISQATVETSCLQHCSSNSKLRIQVKAQPSTPSTWPLSPTRLGIRLETWAYPTNILSATVAFLLLPDTNLLP